MRLVACARVCVGAHRVAGIESSMMGQTDPTHIIPSLDRVLLSFCAPGCLPGDGRRSLARVQGLCRPYSGGGDYQSVLRGPVHTQQRLPARLRLSRVSMQRGLLLKHVPVCPGTVLVCPGTHAKTSNAFAVVCGHMLLKRDPGCLVSPLRCASTCETSTLIRCSYCCLRQDAEEEGVSSSTCVLCRC